MAGERASGLSGLDIFTPDFESDAARRRSSSFQFLDGLDEMRRSSDGMSAAQRIMVNRDERSSFGHRDSLGSAWGDMRTSVTEIDVGRGQQQPSFPRDLPSGKGMSPTGTAVEGVMDMNVHGFDAQVHPHIFELG